MLTFCTFFHNSEFISRSFDFCWSLTVKNRHISFGLFSRNLELNLTIQFFSETVTELKKGNSDFLEF